VIHATIINGIFINKNKLLKWTLLEDFEAGFDV